MSPFEVFAYYTFAATCGIGSIAIAVHTLITRRSESRKAPNAPSREAGSDFTKKADAFLEARKITAEPGTQS